MVLAALIESSVIGNEGREGRKTHSKGPHAGNRTWAAYMGSAVSVYGAPSTASVSFIIVSGSFEHSETE